MMLDVDVRLCLGRFEVDSRFSSEGRLTALFGRSGAGKTTIVNMIGGLIRPENGRIVVDGTVLFDSERKIDISRHRRRIGYVFQEGRLFPHLTVRQNLRYGRWFTPRRDRYGSMEQVIELLGIGHLLDRRPGLLSGGEKQRVAIGRALLSSPRLLLLDEPLAALDEARKAEILPFIERLRDEVRLPIVYVSHSVGEVTLLAETMVLVSDGKVAAVGTVAEVMGRIDLFPLTGRYEAGAVLETCVLNHDHTFGLTRLRSAAGDLVVPLLDLPPGTALRARIRARDVIVSTAAVEGLSAQNVLTGRVVEIGPDSGSAADVRIDVHGEIIVARLTRKAIHDLDLSPGRSVHAIIKSVAFDRRALGRSARNHDGGEQVVRPVPAVAGAPETVQAHPVLEPRPVPRLLRSPDNDGPVPVRMP
jgi:molybdate transport system ATP-binding protein